MHVASQLSGMQLVGLDFRKQFNPRGRTHPLSKQNESAGYTATSAGPPRTQSLTLAVQRGASVARACKTMTTLTNEMPARCQTLLKLCLSCCGPRAPARYKLDSKTTARSKTFARSWPQVWFRALSKQWGGGAKPPQLESRPREARL